LRWCVSNRPYVLGAEMPCSGPGCRHPKPEVHQAPISVTTGGSSLSLLPPKKCKPPAVLRSLPPAALRGGCVIPQTQLQFYGLACGAPPRPLQFYVHCLPCERKANIEVLGGGETSS
jgi:hypothetical protein